jgi:hypothetical protein
MFITMLRLVSLMFGLAIASQAFEASAITTKSFIKSSLGQSNSVGEVFLRASDQKYRLVIVLLAET